MAVSEFAAVTAVALLISRHGVKPLRRSGALGLVVIAAGVSVLLTMLGVQASGWPEKCP